MTDNCFETACGLPGVAKRFAVSQGLQARSPKGLQNSPRGCKALQGVAKRLQSAECARTQRIAYAAVGVGHERGRGNDREGRQHEPVLATDML